MSMTPEGLKILLTDKLQKNISKISKFSGSSCFPSFLVEGSDGDYFVKTCTETTDAFQIEATGLGQLAKHYKFVPSIENFDDTTLVIDFIKTEPPTDIFWHGLAKELAQMHTIEGDFFGFFENNHIGASTQKNLSSPEHKANWALFFWHNRIEYKLEQLKEQSGFELQDSVMNKLKEICLKKLGHYQKPPAPLHGDLWNGNILCGPSQQPYLIDPAFYFGDPEADIAMTECFGGFPPQFYETYYKMRPLQLGYSDRKHIYNLYHMLNHQLIFGDQYKDTVQNIISTII